MHSRKPAARSIFLPWERRVGVLRRLGLSRLRRILLAIAVLAVIVVIGVRERHKTGERATRAAIVVVRRGLDAYRADHEGKCPRQLEDLGTLGYLADVPDDAWGRPLRLVCPSRREGAPYDLSSDGPDGEPGGLDRIE
jgi:general secretion pathway protein G